MTVMEPEPDGFTLRVVPSAGVKVLADAFDRFGPQPLDPCWTFPMNKLT